LGKRLGYDTNIASELTHIFPFYCTSIFTLYFIVQFDMLIFGIYTCFDRRFCTWKSRQYASYNGEKCQSDKRDEQHLYT